MRFMDVAWAFSVIIITSTFKFKGGLIVLQLSEYKSHPGVNAECLSFLNNG